VLLEFTALSVLLTGQVTLLVVILNTGSISSINPQKFDEESEWKYTPKELAEM
jgi:hypothetical protein